MNSKEQSQDFEKLQRLLKIKRYEQPPPRYFNDFSAKVISHIRSDSRREKSSWLRSLWRKLESNPALSGAIATAACGLMVAGVFLMEETKPQHMNFTLGGEQNGAGDNLPAAPVLGSVAVHPPFASTNAGTIPTGPNLFNQLPSLQTVPVSQNVMPSWQK